jgi:hypothetical protein
MNRLAVGALLTVLGFPLRAQVDEPVTVNTAPSDLFPEVTCASTNAGINADILQLAGDAREQLAPVLQLGGAWRFPVHVAVIMPDDPRAGQVHDERVTVEAIGNTMRIDATAPSSDPDLRSFVQRQFVTAMLWEKFFGQSHAFDANTRLDLVPVWLIEGLNEWLNRDSGRNREDIVRRAAQSQRAPSLEEITSWQEISSDRLLGLYQRAFCFYLVNSLIEQGAKRDNFQQWLAKVEKSGPFSARQLFPTEVGWQRQLRQAPERSHDVVYTWDESQSALAATEAIEIPAKKADDSRLCTLDNVLEFASNPKLPDALKKKILDLTALELRAHPGWRPVIAAYRFGLAALADGHPEQARKLIGLARQKRIDETNYHQKLVDYMNWFEVTKDYTGAGSQFRSYFSTAEEMERVQGDPEHPNPVRANVLQVESQL